MIKFGSARIDENGRARGGQRGDQTGREVCEQPAYWHKNGWTGYRAKDPNVANGIAFNMACACRSNIVGYNQDDRYAIFWTNLDQLTNADCSTLDPYCAVRAGVPVNCDGIWTGNMDERLMETGAFDRFTVTDLNALCTGDILVDGKGASHTVVVTEGIPRSWRPVFDVAEPTLAYGSKGGEVRKLQAFFNEYGGGCIIDGDYGSDTTAHVKFFQGICGLKTDGIYGQNTHDMMCFLLYLNGVHTI